MLKCGAKKQGVTYLLHYLDDYIIMGPPGSQEYAANIAGFLEMCRRPGVPIAAEECEGPITKITYLGIEFDTKSMELHLPDGKLQRVKAMIMEWLSCKAGRRRKMESLVWLLQHTAKVVHPGRRFVRRIIALMTLAQERDHFIRLNAEIHSDLQWW